MTEKPPLNAAIVGGGKGCESILRMVAEDRLGTFRMRIVGVADPNLDAPGIQYARDTGVEWITTDMEEILRIPGLDLVIELTGQDAVWNELTRKRPPGVRLIGHFGAEFFFELYTAQQSVIWQRTEMRERVDAQRQWITQIFDSLPYEILVLDSDLVIQDANASFLQNNGYQDISEIRGHHCYEIPQTIRGECLVADDCPSHAAMRDRTTTAVVRKHFDEQGNARFASIVAAPMLDPSGEIIGMIEATRDITHRITLEEGLKTAERRYEQFMKMAPVAAYVKNRGGQYLEANPAACQLLGKKKHEILGKTDLEILPRETAELFRSRDREVLDAGAARSRDEQVTLHGDTIYLSSTRFPVPDLEGNVTAICGLLTDVTALKETESELDETRLYLENIALNSPLIIITTDTEGRIMSFNPGAEATLEYPAEEVIGQHASMLYRTVDERRELIGRVKSEGAVKNYETDLLKKGGDPVPVSITLSLLKDDEGHIVGTVAIVEDVSHRRVLMNQVMQSERMAAVGQLASGVAHEINNPLAVIGEIAGFLSEILEDDDEAKDPETLTELRESLPKITQQVQRCRSITQRLLSFARKSAAQVEETDVNAALEEIIPFVSKDATLAQVTIHRDFTPELPRVKIDELQLQEIFINLIKNAIQAIDAHGGGNIWLGTEEAANGKVLVTVRDDGPGIPRDVQKRIFDPFVTTKAPGAGTGLGLSICYGIIKRYDGQIILESRPGEGAKFQVILPTQNTRTKSPRARHADEAFSELAPDPTMPEPG